MIKSKWELASLGSLFAFGSIWVMASVLGASQAYRFVIIGLCLVHSMAFLQAHKETATLPAQLAEAEEMLNEIRAEKEVISTIKAKLESDIRYVADKKAEYEEAYAQLQREQMQEHG